MHQLTPEARFAALMAEDASRPFVTYYDESTGERSELSRKSLANWVAKTHNLLTDELALGVGDTAALALPAHWISVPVVLGCLTAGLALDDGGSGDVAFGTPDTADGLDAPDRFLVAPARAAVGLGDAVPSGSADYVAAVRPQADAWAGLPMPAGPDDPCLPGLTRREALDRATSRAAELGLADGGRLLTTRDWTGWSDWVDALLAPLAVGGSVVIVRNADEATLVRRVEQERTTARLD
ncbi:TIGR03089 family protein [Jatrophihabitans fulvus]